jgi:hypothetical protein
MVHYDLDIINAVGMLDCRINSLRRNRPLEDFRKRAGNADDSLVESRAFHVITS